MSEVAFLLAAVGLSALGTLLLVLRYRRPTGIEAGVQEFAREMRALAPDPRRPRYGQSPPRPGPSRGGGQGSADDVRR